MESVNNSLSNYTMHRDVFFNKITLPSRAICTIYAQYICAIYTAEMPETLPPLQETFVCRRSKVLTCLPVVFSSIPQCPTDFLILLFLALTTIISYRVYMAVK